MMDKHEKFSMQELMQIAVPEDRVDRLMDTVVFDTDEPISDEVKRYLIRQQVKYVNIQYARFLAGIHFPQDDVDELLAGSIDIHAHGGSEPFERIMLEDDMLKDFTRAGMRATVIKTWYTPSASRNAMLQKNINQWAEEQGLEPVKVFGGITLNQSVGGLNPNAVNDLILASGHYPYKETSVVFEEAIKLGVKHLEVVHPAHIHSKTTIAEMKQYAQEGVKLMLSGLGTLAFPLHESGPYYAARMIHEVGADHFVYGSDFGQIHNPRHIIGNRWMIQILLAYGVSKEDIAKIFKTNPAKHLGLE